MDIHLVTVNNGDIQPELWVFADQDDAERFSDARGNNASVTTLPVMDNVSAQLLINQEDN